MDKITSKSSLSAALRAIYFSKDKMVATDSFRLVEVKKTIALEGEPRVIKAKGFTGRKEVAITKDNLITDGGKLIQGEFVNAPYPDYEKILADKCKKPKATIFLNAKFLAELAAEVDAQAGNHTHKMRVDFFGELEPLLFTAEGDTAKVRAVIMPITN